jgi:hypothetical protein
MRTDKKDGMLEAWTGNCQIEQMPALLPEGWQAKAKE